MIPLSLAFQLRIFFLKLNQKHSKNKISDFLNKSWLKETKYRTNEQGVFFDVETLDLDVLYKTHDIYLDWYCSKNCSDGHPSTIEINKD